MTTALSIKTTEPWCEQSPIYAVEGEKRYITVTFLDVTTISSPSVKVYANKRDVTSVVLPTNSPSAATNVVTLSPIFNMTGVSRYVVAVTATADSTDIRVAKFEIILQRAKMEQ